MANITGNLSLDAEAIAATITQLSLVEFIDGVKPLLSFIIGMTIYAVFIFKFYRFLARRDILKLKTYEYWQAYEGVVKHFFRLAFYVIENLVIIPILVFFWFAVLSGLLVFLSDSPNPETVLLISASIVAAIRITAYYNENLSQDLAKMIPFALLGVFLADVSQFSLSDSWTAIKQMSVLIKLLMYYLLSLTILEFFLRIAHGITSMVIKKEPEPLE